jgi:hypothetical protein
MYKSRCKWENNITNNVLFEIGKGKKNYSYKNK